MIGRLRTPHDPYVPRLRHTTTVGGDKLRTVRGKPQPQDGISSNLLALPDPLPRPDVPQPDPRSLTEVAPDSEGVAVMKEVEPPNDAFHGQFLEAMGMGWIVDRRQNELVLASAHEHLVVRGDGDTADFRVMHQRVCIRRVGYHPNPAGLVAAS